MQCCPQRWRKSDDVISESGQSGAEDTGFETSEQPADLPSVRGEEVSVCALLPVDDPFAQQPSQIIGHLIQRVVLRSGAQQGCHVLPQIAIAEAVDQVLEQSEGDKQSHDSRVAES